MSLVHTDDEVIKLSKDIGKGSSQRFLEFMEVELGIRLAVKNLANVEDEQLYFRSLLNKERLLVILYRIGIIVLSIVDLRFAHFGFKPFEDILRMIWIRFLAKLVVNGVSGCQNKEVLVSFGLI